MTAEQEARDEAVYVPTTEEVREYVEVGGEPRPWLPPTPVEDDARAAAFDRWLASHDAAIAARDAETIAGLEERAAQYLLELTQEQRRAMGNGEAFVAERARADAAEAKVREVSRALDRHPQVCDMHPDGDPIKCGWKSAVRDARAALSTGAPAAPEGER